MKNVVVTENDAVNAAVEICFLRSGAFINSKHLSDVAHSLVSIQAELAKAKNTIEGLAEFTTKVDVKRLEKVSDFLRDARKQLPDAKLDQSGEHIKAGFAVDRSTRDEIRYRYSIGVPIRRLAEDFGIGRTTVRRYLSHNR